MFKFNDRNEMHVHAEREFESLGKRLELDSSECHLHYCDFRHFLNAFLKLNEMYFS
jgi:hypothetical protein